MAHYLVQGKPKTDRASDLQDQLRRDAFSRLQPFGRALTYSLNEARTQPDGTVVWEEEDYCSPPLAEERAAVLDAYFEDLKIEPVKAGEGWKRIARLPKLHA